MHLESECIKIQRRYRGIQLSKVWLPSFEGDRQELVLYSICSKSKPQALIPFLMLC